MGAPGSVIALTGMAAGAFHRFTEWRQGSGCLVCRAGISDNRTPLIAKRSKVHPGARSASWNWPGSWTRQGAKASPRLSQVGRLTPVKSGGICAATAQPCRSRPGHRRPRTRRPASAQGMWNQRQSDFRWALLPTLKQRTLNSPQADGRLGANLKSKVALATFLNLKRLWTLNATPNLIPALGRI